MHELQSIILLFAAASMIAAGGIWLQIARNQAARPDILVYALRNRYAAFFMGCGMLLWTISQLLTRVMAS